MLWTLLMLQLLAHSGVTIGAIIPASLHGHLQYKLTAALQSAAADYGGAIATVAVEQMMWRCLV